MQISKILTQYSTCTQATVEEIANVQKDLQKSIEEVKREIIYQKSEVFKKILQDVSIKFEELN